MHVGAREVDFCEGGGEKELAVNGTRAQLSLHCEPSLCEGELTVGLNMKTHRARKGFKTNAKGERVLGVPFTQFQY
jgi:hypothetical protein